MNTPMQDQTLHAGKSQACNEGENHIDTPVQAEYDMEREMFSEKENEMAVCLSKAHETESLLKAVPMPQEQETTPSTEPLDTELPIGERAHETRYMALEIIDSPDINLNLKDVLTFIGSLSDEQIDIISFVIQEFSDREETFFTRYARSIKGHSYDFLAEESISQFAQELRARSEEFEPDEDLAAEAFIDLVCDLSKEDLEIVDSHMNRREKVPAKSWQAKRVLTLQVGLPARVTDYVADWVENFNRDMKLINEQNLRARAELLAMPKGLRGAYWQVTGELNRELLI